MRKHYKLVSGIACIVLCLAMVVFGVYAASTSLVKLNANVSFAPSTAKLTIQGGIAGSKESKTEQGTSNYFATNYGEISDHKNIKTESDANGAAVFNEWVYSSATFDESYIETPGKTHPDPIYFFIQITNHVERDVDITVDFTSDYTDKNIQVSCLYELMANSAVNAQTDNLYSLSSTSAPMQATTNALVSKSYTTLATDISFAETGAEVDFTTLNQNSSTTKLSTIMIVIKLEVVDADENVDSEKTAFNFVVSVQ